jgi:hypothetical protein
MKTRGTQWGDSIWELELESSEGAIPEPQTGAEDPAPLIRYGGMREALSQGHDEARVALTDVVAQEHVYAVGALEGIAGEITILDSVVHTTSVGTKGGLVPVDGSSLSATMLVGQAVATWQEDPVERSIAPTAFDAAIHDAATAHRLDPSTPFVFVVAGTFIDVRLHVINGACPVHARMHGLELADDARPYEVEVPRIEGTVVGIYAEGKVGELTHPDTRVHAHLVFVDPETGRTVTGHLERVGIAAGSVVRVPQAP